MTTPARFMEAIVGLMQDDEIMIVGNALDVPATTAAEIVNKISPVPDLVIRATSDGSILAYWKKHEEKYADAITTICEPNNAE